MLPRLHTARQSAARMASTSQAAAEAAPAAAVAAGNKGKAVLVGHWSKKAKGEDFVMLVDDVSGKGGAKVTVEFKMQSLV